MKYLVSGALAYDSVLSHKGKFHTRILPESIARLNVSFGVDNVNQSLGGTGGNISYNARLLNDNCHVITNVGNDFDFYKKSLLKNGVNFDLVVEHKDKICSHAWLLTDSQNNQITAFHKGAMKTQLVWTSKMDGFDLYHLSPEEERNTLFLAKKLRELGKNFFIDPGQTIGSFAENDTLKDVVFGAKGCFVNDYEYEILVEYFKDNVQNIMIKNNLEFFVKTKGSDGIDLFFYENDTIIKKSISVCKPEVVVDPTGCGDAFRAGFIHVYLKEKNYLKAAQLGNVMGSFAIEKNGGQNHSPSLSDIKERFFNNYNYDLISTCS